MKKLFFLLFLVLPVISLHARAIQEDRRIDDEMARVSYALGMLMGSNLSTFPLELDYTAFAEGMRSVMEEGREPRMSEFEAVEIVEAAVQIAMDRIARENFAREQEFFAQNRLRPGIIETESGLQYEILVEGESEERPRPNSVVRVLYVGTFVDGTPFDRSADGDGSFIPLDMVIPGWAEGVQLMTEGSKFRFYIPSHLAYGRDGIDGIIPPFSPLVFTVDLLEIIHNEAIDELMRHMQQQYYDYEYLGE